MQYGLYRIEDGGTMTLYAEYPSVVEGMAAGSQRVEVEDLDFAYALYSGENRIVSFREGRIGYRMWAIKTGRISPSVEDRYDKDVDELMS